MILPPVWRAEELETERLKAIQIFREQRIQEPLERYLEEFEKYQGAWEDLLEITVDLTQLEETALDILTDPRFLEAFRYLPGPAISADDLKVLADAVLSRRRLRSDPDMVQRIVDTIRQGLDRRRFEWVAEHREPTAAERDAAVLASAALMANSRTATLRRNEGKAAQERSVAERLSGAGFQQVETRRVANLSQAPSSGQFCGESYLGNGKADFLVTLWDGRLMPIECKVSNSEVNSYKRLNRDTVSKAVQWTNDFGKVQVVPVAVLSGVYKLANLESAQDDGLTLFWGHDLQTMLDWIESTRPPTSPRAPAPPAGPGRRRGADRRRR